MGKLDDLRCLLDRIARERLVLPAPEVERIVQRWCEKHYYDEWRAQRHLFDYRTGRAWGYFFFETHACPWYSDFGVDIELEPPRGYCPWCGDGVWKTHVYISHCGRKQCRDMCWFWSSGAWPRSRPCGEGMYPYMIAEFIKHMAKPKTPKQLEFSKRYAHRRAI